MGTPATLESSTPAKPALGAFVAVLVSALQDKPGFFRAARGRVGVRVVDGPSLTIHFGDLKSPLSIGVDRCDLTLELTDEALGQLLKGTLDAHGALTTGALKLSGDLLLLKTLQHLIARGQSSLAIRAQR